MTAKDKVLEKPDSHMPSFSLSGQGRHEQLYPTVDTQLPLHTFHTSRQPFLTLRMTKACSASPPVELPPELLRWLNEPANIRALEKRFIIREDLFVRHQPLIQSLSPLQLALLTVLVITELTNEYCELRDLNSLNSAIRLTDHLLQLPPELLTQLPQLQAVITKQFSIIEQIYHEPTF